jgi:formate/nitrite transporter FocA (FNT family)
MKKVELDPNWWRAILASIAVTSALIVAACISGLPSITCTALAKTYFAAIYNFGFSAMLAASLFLLCMFVSAVTDSKTISPSKKPPPYIFPVLTTIAGTVIFAAAISAGIESLNKSVADCWKQ